MTELFITKGLSTTYAASKTSSTVNTATTPDLLADGAIGIYYVNSSGILTLLAYDTDAATTIASAVSGAGLPISRIEFIYAVGTATSSYVTIPLASKDAISVIQTEYAAPTKQQSYIGYDGVSTAKNFGLTAGNLTGLRTYDIAGVNMTFRPRFSVQDTFKTYSASLTAGDTEWNIASKLADAVNVYDPQNLVVAEVVTPAIGTTVGTVSSVTVTKGSNVVTLGAAGSVVAGDYLQFGMLPLTNTVGAVPTSLNGVTYRIVSGGGTTTLVLDRNWSGETQTFTTLTWVTRTATAPTAAAGIGVRLITQGIGFQSNVSTVGVLGSNRLNANSNYVYNGASITECAVGGDQGTGTPALVAKLEADMFVTRGNLAVTDGTLPRPTSRVNYSIAAGGYDLLYLKSEKNTGLDGRKVEYNAIFAFEDGNNTQEATFITIFNGIYGIGSTTVAQVVKAGKTVINAGA